MIRSVKQMVGHKLGASDGHIGHIKDFYFDDALWVVRYLVADTGTWLTGRMVLISPLALGGFDEGDKVLRVNLTRRQIENCPSTAEHKPISRQYEEEYFQYYNWPFYWQGGALWGLSDFPTIPPLPLSPPLDGGAKAKPEDAHLRSATSVLNYTAHGVDKEAGSVADILVDDRSWLFGGMVVENGKLGRRRKTAVPSGQIGRISWPESAVYLKTTTEALERAPEYEAVGA
jgi:hypothetical protein